MKIGIVSAMQSEIDYLLEEIMFEEIHLKKNTFFLGEYQEYELIVVATGVGKVNAATYTQILIDRFSPDCLINIGIAGGLSDKIKPLDIVVGDVYSHHDVDIIQMKQLFPYTHQFYANAHLLDMFKHLNLHGVTGTIVSGEKFIADNKERKDIIDTFNAVAVDMETSAMAHTCFINEMPFISLRGISDLANEQAEQTYEKNKVITSRRVVELLLAILNTESINKLSDKI